jgi:O-antigen ligase
MSENILSTMRSISGRSLEMWLLLLFVATVPALEAPKNVFGLTYLLIWVLNRARQRHWGGSLDLWDLVILMWISSGLISTAFGGLPGGELSDAVDPLRSGLILLAAKRGGYTTRFLIWILIVALASAIASLAVALGQLFVLHQIASLELHSVGHINHTAIYLSISLAIAAAFALSYWNSMNVMLRGISVTSIAILFSGTLLTVSRGAIAAAIGALILLGIFFTRKYARPGLRVWVICAVLAAVGVMSNETLIKKQKDLSVANNAMSFRLEIWNVAVAAWREHPITGVGRDNFSLVTMDQLRSWHSASGRTFDETRYFPISHAHSLFFNTLAERGTIGIMALMAFLAAWVTSTIKLRPKRNSSNAHWAIWGASAGALLINVLAGLFNTTLHHEHAILSSICLGCWLAQLQNEPDT